MQFHTEFQYDPAQDRRAGRTDSTGVRNGSSWRRGAPGRAVVLFSQHAGDVSSLELLNVVHVPVDSSRTAIPWEIKRRGIFFSMIAQSALENRAISADLLCGMC